MIVATFNVENLFERPKAMNEASWSKGQPALDAAGELNSLFNKPVDSPADKRRMVTLLKKFSLLETWARNPYLELRKVRGRLTPIFRPLATRGNLAGRAEYLKSARRR